MSPQGMASYPGIQQIHAARVTITHGVSPGVIRLEIAPQATLPSEIGTLELSFGDVRIRLEHCRVRSASLKRDGAGELVSLELSDRRWKWRFGALDGSYNAPGPDGWLAREQTPQQLAARCLSALGERDFDVSQLPNDARPRITWDGQPPATALAELCDSLGSRVVLRLNGTVAIRRLGVTAGLPAGPLMRQTGSLTPVDELDEIVVRTGPNRYQADLELEAVGLDTDGAIRPIDELSYRPSAGWSRVDLPWLHSIADPVQRELARKTLFRWYRVRTPVEVPGVGLIAELTSLLPLFVEQLQTTSGDEDAPARALPAWLFGVWCDERDARLRNVVEQLTPVAAGEANGLEAASIVARPWRLDAERGLVLLDAPLFALDESVGGLTPRIGPAQLRLRTSFSLRDPQTGAPVRYQQRRVSGRPRQGTPPLMIDRRELTLRSIARYDTNYGLQSLDTNLPRVSAGCDAVLDAAWQAHWPVAQDAATYAGLLAIELDGAVRRVTWNVGPNGATTSVMLNHEPRRLEESLTLSHRPALPNLVATSRDMTAPLEAI